MADPDSFGSGEDRGQIVVGSKPEQQLLGY
jgi:hypothetical protein